MACVLLLSLALASPASAGGSGRQRRDPDEARYQAGPRTKGAVLGALAGFGASVLFTVGHMDDESFTGSDIREAGLLFIVGGAAAGFAIGSTYARKVDAALERGRESVREADRAGARDPSPLAALALAPVRGFVGLEVVSADDGIRLARID